MLEDMGPDYNYQQNVNMSRNPNMNFASTGSRIIAYIIDSIILSVISVGIFFAVIFLGFLSLGSFTGDSLGVFGTGFFNTTYIGISFGSFLLQLLYFTYLESREGGGATLGKKLMDIKVVNQYGKKADMSSTFVRNIVRILWSIPCIGFIILLFEVYLIHDKEQRIGDKLANTYVVKDIEEYGEITRQYQEGYRQQGFQPQVDQREQKNERQEQYDQPRKYDRSSQTQTGEMQKCPKCGKKSLMVSPDGTAYCTRCDYTSMDNRYNQ
ncbi:MAG: RDD family protein [Thermoplasmata archaeon]